MTTEDHTRGPVPCDQVGMFVDGELDAERAEAFRQHLVHCARCQSEMHALLQLAGLAEEASHPDARSAQPVALPHPAFLVRKRVGRLAMAGGAVLAAAMVGVVMFKQRQATDVPALLASVDTRSVSGWPSALGVVTYHGYDTVRGVAPPAPSAGLATAELRAEQAENWRTAGTLALLRRDFPRADGFLARLPPTPDVLADRGLIRLEQGNCDEALEYLDQALRKEVGYAPAQFNRGLCLRRMDLVAAAASTFGGLASANLGGWSAEARAQADDLERALRRRDEVEQSFRESGPASVEHQEPIPAEVVARFPGRARVRFYRMLAEAPGGTELKRLIPIAQTLDHDFGGSALQARARNALAAVRPEREEIAHGIHEFYRTFPSDDALDALIERARRARQDDQALLLFDEFKFLSASPERKRLNEKAADPFSRVMLAAATAYQERGAGRLLEAEQTLREARKQCRDESLSNACWYLDVQLVDVELALSRFDDASRIALASAQKMRTLGARGQERNSRLQAAQVQLAAGKVAAARGSFEDLGLREPDACQVTVYRNEQLAAGYVRRGDVTGAKAALAGLPGCATAEMAPWRLALRLELAVLEHDAHALGEVMAASEAFSRQPGTTSEDRAIAGVLAARAAVELDRPGASSDLTSALARLDDYPGDIDATQARTRGWVTLGLSELRRGSASGALQAISRQLGVEPPTRCALALLGDNSRRGWSTIDASGVAVARLEASDARTIPAPAGCRSVAVFASGWEHVERALPDTVAWTVRLVSTPSPAGAEGERLLVRDVRPPSDLQLPALGLRATRSGTEWSVLEGLDATPDRVLRSLRRASYAEFEVHGLIDAAVPDGAFLVLSQDTDGRYALSARDVEGQRLTLRPVVMLGACRAAAGSTVREESWTLPRAFLTAGARAVYAARVELPDAEVGAFFAGIRERLDRGEQPSTALRDEKLAWLGKGRTWVRDVLLFD
jgi:cellulose synthase operon protein C